METDAALRFDRLLLLIGRLNYMWTNNESLLIHVIAGLSGTDKETAVIIFLTLNTTRARMDLVERLAKRDSVPSEERDRILAWTGALGRLSSLRNKYNHCIYSFDRDSGTPQTILMRVSDRKDAIRFGRMDAVDDAEMARIEGTLEDLVALNKSMWRLIKDQGYPL